jgi:hypothetical protein
MRDILTTRITNYRTQLSASGEAFQVVNACAAHHSGQVLTPRLLPVLQWLREVQPMKKISFAGKLGEYSDKSDPIIGNPREYSAHQ